MENSPFSFYDFLGYLFPGAISLLFISFFCSVDSNTYCKEYFNFELFIEQILILYNSNSWVCIIVVIIFSYAIGHLISFLSSITIEYFSNMFFGYPSKYLLNDKEKSIFYYYKKYFKCKTKVTFIWRILLIIFLFPITVVIMIFGNVLNINQHITRSLDDYTIDNIKVKQGNLLKKLNLQNKNNNIDKADIHSLVMYYVYFNVPDRQRKADNYIALYGFLRSMTLILCSLTLYISCFLIFNSNYNVDYLLIDLILILLCNISFMSFVKIYRRFTKEDYLTLLTCKQ